MDAEPTTTYRHGRGRTILTWVLRVLLAGQFLMAGGMKVAGTPEMVELFDTIGLGQWFRYVTGGLEIAGAIGLLIPGLVGLAAVGLAGVMIGAALTDLVVLGSSPLMPLVLLVLTVIVAWLTFGQAVALVRRVTDRDRGRIRARSN